MKRLTTRDESGYYHLRRGPNGGEINKITVVQHLGRLEDVALRPASRERVEKVWRGEWQYHPEDYDELTWTCSRCGEVWTLIDGTPDDNNMDFCPACGSPMTDEAVEMVMERLEALKDGDLE